MKAKTLLLIMMVFAKTIFAITSPTIPSTNITFPIVSSKLINLELTSGNGTSRIIIMKQSGAVSFTPVNGVYYGVNSSLGDGQIIVYNGTGNSCSINRYFDSALLPNATYYFAVYEYNGISTGETYYLNTALTGQQAATVSTSEPATSSNTLVFSNVEGNKMNLSWTNGSGSNRIVVAKKGSSLTGIPIDGQSYVNYQKLADGSTIIYNGSGTNCLFSTLDEGKSQLEINTNYTISVFEYNGSGIYTNYKTNSPLNGSKMTLNTAIEPSISVTSRTIIRRYQEIDGSSKDRLKIEFSWDKVPETEKYIIIAREGNAVDLTKLPIDGKSYSKDQSLGNGNFIAYTGIDNLTEFKQDPNNGYQLKPNTIYHFVILPYNGTGITANYKTNSPFIFSEITLPDHPTTKASNFNTSNLTHNSFNFNWTNGSGSSRMVIVNTNTSNSSFIPTNGISPSLNSQVSTGQFVLFNGAGTGPGGSQSLSISSINGQPISNGVTYNFIVYEYNGSTNNQHFDATYLNGFPNSNTAFSITTNLSATEPTQQINSLGAFNITSNSMNLYWNNGDGSKRILIASTTGPITSIPSDGITYTVGNQLNSNEYVIYNGASNLYTFNSFGGQTLNQNTTYYISSFEYNGTGTATNYLITNPTTIVRSTLSTIFPEPTVQVSSLNATNPTTNSMLVYWNNGNGSTRIVIASKNGSVSSSPVDQTLYNVGDQINSNEYVIYKGSGNSFTFNSFAGSTLEPGTSYFIKAFEFNGSANSTNFLLTNAPSTTKATLNLSGLTTEPTTQVTAFNAYNITSNSMTSYWNNGNGTNRLVIASEFSPITSLPVDGVGYNINFELNSNEFVVYNSSGNSFNFNSLNGLVLNPNTTYYLKVFEYNGAGITANYLITSAPSFSKSTTGVGTRKNEFEFSTMDEVLVFPNPAIDNITIQSNIEVSNIKIWNSRGEELSFKLLLDNNSVDISRLTKGIYYLNIYSENKIIKQEKISVQ